MVNKMEALASSRVWYNAAIAVEDVRFGGLVGNAMHAAAASFTAFVMDTMNNAPHGFDNESYESYESYEWQNQRIKIKGHTTLPPQHDNTTRHIKRKYLSRILYRSLDIAFFLGRSDTHLYTLIPTLITT